MRYSSKMAIIFGMIALILFSTALAVHFRLSDMQKSETEFGVEENESPSQVIKEIGNSLQNKESEDSELENEEYDASTALYLEVIDGIQVVSINATEFKFIPSEIHINSGPTKFIITNSGIGEHEFVVYELSKKDIVDKAEIDEDEETIKKNVLFEVEEINTGEHGESQVMNIEKGTFVIACHIPGHYEAGMKGTLIIN